MSRVKVRETTHVVTLRLSTDDYFWLKAVSAVTGRSMNETATQVLRFAVEWEEGQIMTSDQALEVSRTLQRWKEKEAE